MPFLAQLQEVSFVAKMGAIRFIPSCVLLTLYFHPWIQSFFKFSFTWNWQLRDFHYLSILLIVLCSAGYRNRNYHIRTARFLDFLGHPYVRKWQFDTPEAAATFQCLVICRDITRPIRSINVFALLDMLIPDQRVVCKAWKERVADRIVHEMNILFAPTIPTFGDERQQQLKDLLDQAQLGYYAYRDFCIGFLNGDMLTSESLMDPLADFHCQC